MVARAPPVGARRAVGRERSRGQNPLSKRVKHLCVVVLAQTICLSVGLWAHLQYTRSSIFRAAVEATFEELASAARNALTDLEALQLSAVTPQGPERDLVAQRLAALGPSQGGIMLVDSQWRVVLEAPDERAESAPPSSHGTQLSWIPINYAVGDRTPDEYGTLDLPDGPHVAVAHALNESQGYLVAHRLRADVESSVAALLGSLPAISFLTFLWTCALLSIAVYMVLARCFDEVERDRIRGDADTARQKQELIRTRDAIIFGLAKLADSRDPETGDHIERIAVYSTTLAAALRRDPKYRRQITPGFARLIGISAVLHDIGKVGIEDRILRKPSSLTDEERALMQTHATIGGSCLREIELRLGSSNFLQMAREIAYTHHEHWDGTGYPKGLTGTQIPLAGRIVAIVDMYDALSSKRVYKKAYAHAHCVATIRQESGRKLDPELVEAWLAVESRFAELARQYGDDAAEPLASRPTEHGLRGASAGEREQEPKVLASSAAIAEQ